ncbi:MAG: molecular chaperone TorD family protein [Slackia sp.]|nr:molecular chaperone TorD family protein [Slackia sp.]
MIQETSYRIVDERRNAEMLADEAFLQAFSASAEILGACFVFHPVKEQAARAFALLRDIDVENDWPFGDASQRAQAAACLKRCENEFPEAVSEEFSRLLRGAGFSPAPPWGSVYMDRDKVMYGRTWVALRDWMRAHAIDGRYAENDPEDQFGRLLMLASAVAHERPDVLCELLGDHILCWSERFLRAFSASARTDAYRGAALLCEATLSDVRDLLAIEPARRRLYK